MEQLIKIVPTFEVSIGEDNTIKLSAWELTALQLWLVMANKTPEAKPLWLKGRKFVHRVNDIISFEGGFRTLDRGQVIDLINAIHDLTTHESTAIYLLGVRYPTSNSWQCYSDSVDLNETTAGSFIGYWRVGTKESILPVKLRWSEDLGTWYGVKGVSHHGISFKFKNLTIGQI